MGEHELWQFFLEVQAAVEEGNAGLGPQPYRAGNHMVSALAGDVELSVKDISEEDAILIAGELKERGVRALVTGSRICGSCGRRVPDQAYCVSCRSRLTDEGDALA